MSNVNLGSRGIDLPRGRLSAGQVVSVLLATDEERHTRQLAVVNKEGTTYAWTGRDCVREVGRYNGENYSMQANMMTGTSGIEVMKHAYSSVGGDLARRMLNALRAAQKQGGDIRRMQSAAIKVVGGARIDH